MKGRRLLVGLGTAVTTFLLVFAVGGDLLAPFVEPTVDGALTTLVVAAVLGLLFPVLAALVSLRRRSRPPATAA